MNVMRDNYSMGGSVSGVRPPSIMLADVSPTPLRPPLNSISQMQMQEMNATGNGNNGNVNINISINAANGAGGGAGCGAAAVSNNNNLNGGSANSNSSANALRDSRTLPVSNRIGSRSVSQDSVYTILIRLPPDGASSATGSSGAGGVNNALGNQGVHGECGPSIKMIHEDISTVGAGSIGVLTTAPPPPPTRRPLPSRDSEFSLPLGRRMSHAPQDMRLLNAKVIPKQLGKTAGQNALLNARNAAKKKKKSQEKRQESKAAKTLSAILLSFIITWTPYNILVLIKPLTTCSDCIPTELWDFFYALCYINSTINPMCYALCNASFRRTYIRILTCKWQSRNREGMVRGVYN